MTRFLDGPAAGIPPLYLKRAPKYLRVVRSAAGTWDALDQLTDTPKSDETIIAYVMVSGPTWVHVRRDRRHGGSGFFQGGEYRVVDPQPADEVMRSTSSWRAWVSEQVGVPVAADGTMEAGQ